MEPETTTIQLPLLLLLLKSSFLDNPMASINLHSISNESHNQFQVQVQDLRFMEVGTLPYLWKFGDLLKLGY